MSLEDMLKANTAALEANTAALNAVLAGAPAAAATPAADKPKAEAKPKADPKPKADAKAKNDGFAELKEALSAWLQDGCIGGKEDHPEVLARKAALKETLGKLKAEKLGELEGNETDIARLLKWLNEKAKKVDNGFGEGRFVADEEDGAATGDDDEL